MTRKEEILNAVINGFHQEGFTMDLSLSQIAKKVNIGKSTLYEYFKNKDEMYTEAILLMINSNTEESLLVENINELKFEIALKKQLRALLNAAYKSRMMLEMFTKNFIQKLPDSIRTGLQKTMEAANENVSNRFILIFGKGIQEGILGSDIEPLTIEVVTCLIVGSVVRYSDRSKNIDLELLIEEMYKNIVLIGK